MGRTIKLGRREALFRGGVLTGAALAGPVLGAGLLGCVAPAPGGRLRAAPSVRERAVERVLTGARSRDGAGVSLLRHLGHGGLPSLDPFVLLDEIQSSDPRDYAAGFPTHPHRGFETVTVMLQGAMQHRDSVGNSGLLVGGGAQWMTAGRGILHSEMPRVSEPGQQLWGFQLWVNLPNRERWCEPQYQDLEPARVPEVGLDRGGRLRLIGGEALGVQGPIAPRDTRPLLATVELRRGDDIEITLDREHAGLVVVAQGQAEIGRDRAVVREDQTATLAAGGDRLRLRAPESDATLLVVAGQPLRERYVHRGPFVMETEADIAQAFADYRAGRLGT